MVNKDFSDIRGNLKKIVDPANRLKFVRTQSYRIAFYFHGGPAGDTVTIPLNNFQDKNGIEMTGTITLTFDGVNWSGSHKN